MPEANDENEQGLNEQGLNEEDDALSETRALIPQATRTEIAELYTWGKMMRRSGFFKDVQSEAAAAVKILMGRALGFDMISSMTGLHIVEGRPTLGANLMAHAVKRSGKYTYRVIEHDDEHCLVEFSEKVPETGWQVIGTSEFTMRDAERAGLVKPNSNWVKWPRNMTFARALSNGVRWHCPDVFDGTAVYTPEELRPEMEITEDGEPVYIESTFVQDPEPAPQAQRQQQRDIQPERERGPGRPAGGQRGGRGGQPATSAQPEAPAGTTATAGERKPPPSKMAPDDWKLVRSLQTLMTWAHEAYGKVQRDVTGTLGLGTLPDISAKYQTSEDYQEAVLELLHEWDIERYTRWMDEQVNGPLADGSAEDTDAEVDADEHAAAAYDADAAGPDSTVEVTDDGSILVGGEPAEPLP